MKAAAAVDPVWIGPDPAAGSPASFEHKWMSRQLEGLPGFMVNEWFRQMYGEDAREGAPEWVTRLALLYGAAWLGARRAGRPMLPREHEMYLLCRAGDAAAARLRTDVYKYMECNLTNLKGGSAMAKKTGSKETKKARVTASSVLIPILSRASVPTDDEIIATIKAATGSGLFDPKQLAWYKWKFRQGKLKGMDGKLHAINQGAAHKKEAPAKKAAKKVVLKKKAA